MASSRLNASISRAALAALATIAISSSTAFASQGPGGGMGTASHFTQTMMAVIVYGISAVVACASLIVAARRR